MSKTDLIHECDGLSLELKKILAKAGILTFTDLSKYTCLSLRTLVPKLKVRHLANLKHALNVHKKSLVSDGSIELDRFIDQRKLFNLWNKGVDTYRLLDELPFLEFVEAMGGPHARFFKDKRAARRWLERNELTIQKRFELPHLPMPTSELLYNGGVLRLEDTVALSDHALAKILQPTFGRTQAKLTPLTRVRLIEIKYALWKEGIDRPCKPL